MLRTYEKPLTWGLSVAEFKKQLPNVDILAERGRVRCGCVSLVHFPGDCGALLMTSANNATTDSIKLAVKTASYNGFSKIFATVVGEDGYIDAAVEAFKKARFKCVEAGNSNRSAYKKSFTFVKIIKNCKYKGY